MLELLIIALIKFSVLLPATTQPGDATPTNPTTLNTETPPPTRAESGGNTWGEGGVR